MNLIKLGRNGDLSLDFSICDDDMTPKYGVSNATELYRVGVYEEEAAAKLKKCARQTLTQSICFDKMQNTPWD